MMIKEAFRKNKHFVLARIDSRGSDSFAELEGPEEMVRSSSEK